MLLVALEMNDDGACRCGLANHVHCNCSCWSLLRSRNGRRLISGLFERVKPSSAFCNAIKVYAYYFSINVSLYWMLDLAVCLMFNV